MLSINVVTSVYRFKSYNLIFKFLCASVFALISQIGVVQAEDLGLGDLSKKVELRTLSNGLRVLFYKRGVAPVFAGVVTVRVGGVDEVLGETGNAHMLEHMLFKGTDTLGTKNYSKERRLLNELEKLVDQNKGRVPTEGRDLAEWNRIQSQLSELWDDEVVSREYNKVGGTSLNASTSQELTRYFVQLPSSAFEFWCWMESQRLFEPVFRQFYKERDVVLEERRMRFEDSPGGKLYEALISTAFKAHPYRFPTIGYSFDLERLRPAQAKAFLHKYYVPRNMIVALVGDVDADRDLPTVEKYFGGLVDRPVPEQVHAIEPTQIGPRQVTVKHSSSPSLYVAYKKPVYPNPEDAKITVMSEIYAGSIVSPLYKELVERRQIATSVSSFEAPGYLYPNILAFSLVPRAPTTNQQLLSQFEQLLEQVKRKTVTEDQLQIAKKAITVSLVERFSSNLALAQELASAELLYGEWEALLKWHKQVQEVTAQDVKESAEKYLVMDKRTVAFLERS